MLKKRMKSRCADENVEIDSTHLDVTGPEHTSSQQTEASFLARLRPVVQLLHRGLNRRRIVPLLVCVLPETAFAGLAAERLDHKRKARAADFLRGLLVADVQRRFVGEADVNPFGAQALGGVVGA